MTDTPRSGSPSDAAEPYPTAYPAHTDPAYAGNYAYGPTYSPTGPPNGGPSTQALPPYWTQTYGQPPPSTPPAEPPRPPRAPRWLWVAAGATIAVVIALVGALVFTNRSSRNDTVTEPRPSAPERPTAAAPSPTPVPPPALPLPTAPPPTDTTTAPGATQTVVYEVSGAGRAINITYVDTGRLMQTEFNVLLPWRKEVNLPSPAADSASLTVINVGREITCSISVGGTQVEARTGAGLTICTAR